MRPIVAQVGPLAAADATAVCTSQTPTAAFVINGDLASGGVATLDVARRILFNFGGNDGGNTLTITGTGREGLPQTEVLPGVNGGSTYTKLDFKTVTGITLANPAAASIVVGTNGVASSAWVRLDDWVNGQVALQCSVTGTVNYTVEQTLDDPNSSTSPVLPYACQWLAHPDSAFVAATATAQSAYAYAPRYCRVTLNSGTGSVAMTVIQHSSPQ